MDKSNDPLDLFMYLPHAGTRGMPEGSQLGGMEPPPGSPLHLLPHRRLLAQHSLSSRWPVSAISLLCVATVLGLAATAVASLSGWHPAHLPAYILRHPATQRAWLVSRPRLQAFAVALLCTTAGAVLCAPGALLLTSASLLFAHTRPPRAGALVLLAGGGCLLLGAAAGKWKAQAFSQRRCRQALLAAALGVAHLLAFQAGASFSGAALQRDYRNDSLYFAVMSLAFGTGLLPLAPLFRCCVPNTVSLIAVATAEFEAPTQTKDATQTRLLPAAESRGAAFGRLHACLSLASALCSLAGAAAYAGFATERRGAGFVAAGAVMGTDVLVFLVWSRTGVTSTLDERPLFAARLSPAAALITCGLARACILVFPPKHWFLGHALLIAASASALAVAAACRVWPRPKTPAELRRDAFVKALHVAVPTAAADQIIGAPQVCVVLLSDEQLNRALRLWRRLRAACLDLMVALACCLAVEIGVVAYRTLPPVPGLDALHPQWQFGIAAALCPPTAVAVLAFVRALQSLPAATAPPQDAQPASSLDTEAAVSAPVHAAPAAAESQESAAHSSDFLRHLQRALALSSTAGRAAGECRSEALYAFFIAPFRWDPGAPWPADLPPVLTSAAASSVVLAALGIALGFATDAPLLLAAGCFLPLGTAAAVGAIRDAPHAATSPWLVHPRAWTPAQRRLLLWLLLDAAACASAAAVSSLNALDASAARAAALHIADNVLSTPYRSPRYSALAIGLGSAWAQAIVTAALRLHAQLDLRETGVTLLALALGLPLAWAGASAGLAQHCRLKADRPQWRNMDATVGVVTGLGCTGGLCLTAGMLLWRDRGLLGFCARPQVDTIVLMLLGALALVAVAVLAAVELGAAAGATICGGVLLALLYATLTIAKARNGGVLPRAALAIIALALLVAAGAGLVAGLRSHQPFAGVSVAWLLVCVGVETASLRRLATAQPAPMLSPVALFPVWQWHAPSSRPRPLNLPVAAACLALLGIYMWGAVASALLATASIGAAVAVGATAAAACAVCAACHSAEVADSEAAAVVSSSGAAQALWTARQAVGRTEVQQQTSEVQLTTAKWSAWVSAVRSSGFASQEATDASAALCEAAQDEAVRSANQQLHIAVFRSLVREAAKSELAEQDVRLRAFLVGDFVDGAYADVDLRMLTPDQRKLLIAAHATWAEARKRDEEEQRRKAAEEEEGRRRRAAIVAAEEERRRKAVAEEARREEAELERLRKAAEEEQRRKEAKEEARRKAAAEEEERRRVEEEERRRIAEAEEEARRRAAEEEARKKLQTAEEERRKAEEERRRRAAIAAAEEENRRKAAEEKERRRKAEEERRRLVAIAAEEKRRKAAAEEEARRKAAEEEAERLRKLAADDDGLAACTLLARELMASVKGNVAGSFFDADFEAGPRGLYTNGSGPGPGESAFSIASWRRPPPDAVLFASSGGATRADATRVQQGALGDCWAISAMAVLAAGDVDRVAPLFLTPPNRQGAYVVRLFRAGRWVPVVLDDRLPVSGSNAFDLVFAQSSDHKELWPSLLEKALAKFYGSYEGLSGGWVCDALVDLTGGAGETVPLRGDTDGNISAAAQKEELWARIFTASKGGGGGSEAVTLLGCSSNAGKDTSTSKMGIVLGHAYSMLAVHEVDGHRLLKLRNPWGSGMEWKGDWGDTSPLWTPRMRKRLDYSPKVGDGIFYMAFDDFMQQYRAVYACRIFPPSAVHSVTGAWDPSSGGSDSMWDSTWTKNARYKLQRLDGRAVRTTVHVTLLHVADDEGQAAHSREKDRGLAVRLYIFKDPGASQTFTSWGPSDMLRLNEAMVGPAGCSYDRQQSLTLDLDACAAGWLLVPTAALKPTDKARFALTVFTTEPVALTKRS